MTRRHILNPAITVIMETVGSHQDVIARAIKSFLAQDYPRALLLIINYHPSPLRLLNLPRGANIEVLNAEDMYVRHIFQHWHNLTQVRTDAWTILDDDDWLEPDHLSLLAESWNACTDRTDKPLRVLAAAYHAHYDSGVELKEFPGWAACLFERLTPEEIQFMLNLFPADLYVGSDTWIASNSIWDQRDLDPAQRFHTYHWERRGNSHVSNHEHNPNKTESDRFAYALNFWRLKLAARQSQLLPIDLQ